MKKRVLAFLMAIIFCVTVLGCGSDMVIDGKKYDTYGLFTLNEKADGIQYSVIKGNVIWGLLLFETIVFPVYFFGFSLYEPVGKEVKPLLKEDETTYKVKKDIVK